MTAPGEIFVAALSEGLASYQMADKPARTLGLLLIAVGYQHRNPRYWKMRVQA